MAFAVTIKPLLLALVIFHISALGNAYDDVPEAEGTGYAGYDPFTGTTVVGDEPRTGTGVGGDVPQTGEGIVGDDPAQIVAKALLCFNEKHIYSSCEESYRLTQSGYLNVPPEYVDHYCDGPCLTETHLVLNCLEGVMSHFLFYNKATIEDIRDTIKAGCGHGPERGDFDVAEHLQAEENSAYKTVIQIIFGLAMLIIGNVLLL